MIKIRSLVMPLWNETNTYFLPEKALLQRTATSSYTSNKSSRSPTVSVPSILSTSLAICSANPSVPPASADPCTCTGKIYLSRSVPDWSAPPICSARCLKRLKCLTFERNWTGDLEFPLWDFVVQLRRFEVCNGHFVMYCASKRKNLIMIYIHKHFMLQIT